MKFAACAARETLLIYRSPEGLKAVSDFAWAVGRAGCRNEER